MRIGESERSARPAASAAVEGHAAPEAGSGRALVALAPAAPAPSAGRYRQAPFLAHLLAVKDQHAQTRERRRADPAEAVAAYRTAARLSV